MRNRLSKPFAVPGACPLSRAVAAIKLRSGVRPAILGSLIYWLGLSLLAAAPRTPRNAGGPCIWSPPLTNAAHQIDAAATLQVLRQNGFRCYVALIWQNAAGASLNLAGFRPLLARFDRAGIDVWVVLIPPSEGGNSMPYGRHYQRWMRALASLSLRYPRLRGVNIDDFISASSMHTFTPAYACRLYRAKQAINPKLKFMPTVYALDRNFARRYGACLDGVWLWWTNLDRGARALRAWLENSRLVIRNRFPIYGGVYARHTSWHLANPQPAIFANALDITCAASAGAVIWQMPLRPLNPWLLIAREFGAHGAKAGRCGAP